MTNWQTQFSGEVVYRDDTGLVLCGNALDVLKGFPDNSISCVVTSPPYWGLRDYQVDGQIGLEKTPEEYVAKLVDVFREVKRVLKPDGTLWLNLGDSYVSGKGRYSSCPQTISGKHRGEPVENNRPDLIGHKYLKDKDLCGIPWAVAKALQQPYYIGKIKNEADRIWLAAMIDGEGCMFIHKRKTGQSNGQGYIRRNDSYGAGLEVANTHESIVKRCLVITGMGSICCVERETKLKKRNIPLYRWNLRSNQCREVVQEIYPYLVGKKQEARLLLGCPSSGDEAEKAHQSLMALHNGQQAIIDFDEPKTMYEQGYWLRQDIIWSKNNPMPESVTDRCTKSHEYIFLLSKSAKYFYDHEAIKEDSVDEESYSGRRFRGRVAIYGSGAIPNADGNTIHSGNNEILGKTYEKRNRRSVWNIAVDTGNGVHFAVYPEELVTPCILAGCPKDGIVLDCFGGSCTTGKVAAQLGRKYVCIELNPKYITDVASTRLTEISTGVPVKEQRQGQKALFEVK